MTAPGRSRLCCGVNSRGIALYEGKVIVPVIDGRLQAIDAKTGKMLWSVLAIPQTKEGELSSYSITMAPRVANGKIFIGNAGAEFPPYRGYVSAYDVNTGKELWRFYTVPGDPSKKFESKAMEQAAKTWTGEWWKQGGGGSYWDGMAYDPDANLVYAGTGNGAVWSELPNEKRVERGVFYATYDNAVEKLGPGTTGTLTWCGDSAYFVRDAQKDRDKARLLRWTPDNSLEVVYETRGLGDAFLAPPACADGVLTVTAYAEGGDERVWAQVPD